MKTVRTLLLAVAFGTLPSFAYAHGEHTSAPAAAATAPTPFGVPGDPKAATRTIAVAMDDTMRFTPSSLAVKQGETVTFVIRNNGKLLHELVLGTPKDLEQHAQMMRNHPGMQHDEPYIAHVQPGATQRLTWRFTQGGNFEFACLVPGHLEAGMKGTIVVAATAGGASAK